MKFFYAFMVWITEFELAIAMSTGRNPDDVRMLKQDLQKWRNAQTNWEINNGYA